jgi:hypothetical protein
MILTNLTNERARQQPRGGNTNGCDHGRSFLLGESNGAIVGWTAGRGRGADGLDE